ncbi:MAG: hypothetical protein MUC54_01150 [Chloroflexi bacterium]|jgi:hypothetical protein|nr:hypothetical protein [Chloroflexota bacterium]
MPGDDLPLDHAPAAGHDPGTSGPADPGPAPGPGADGDLAFAPGAQVPLPPPPDEAPRCPWCSAALDDPGAPTCASCGAQLAAPEAVEVPGVTAVDPALLALANRPKPERRSLASWLSGDSVDEYPLPTQSELAALAPPDQAVRREMRRMALAAMGIVAEERGADAGQEPPPDAAGEAESAGEAASGGEGVPPGGGGDQSRAGEDGTPAAG